MTSETALGWISEPVLGWTSEPALGVLINTVFLLGNIHVNLSLKVG